MDFQEIPVKCFVPLCNQRVLSNRSVCQYCMEQYCGQHFPPFSHNCSSGAHIFLVESQTIEHSALLHIQSYACSSEGCPEYGPMKLECCNCGKHFCQSHHRHGCLDPLRKELMAKRAQRETLRRHHEAIKESINNVVEAAIEKHLTRPGPKLALASQLKLMRMKQQAVGHQNIPMSNRAYFLVHWKSDDARGLDRKAIYVSKEWAVEQVTKMVGEQCNIFTMPWYTSCNDLRLFYMDGQLITENLTLLLKNLITEKNLVDGENILIGIL
ncbi:AN1-type zinc finger protein 1-like [Thrips palmi]|uniref:AN1-type zinc finger protein 1-like n=1 Tax=Thrips palmi TaxID=161013 RepID=A0A6P8Z4R4_THRPL|nr:AN1-type zinc finger protein 1-like [Thrips palmi]